MSLLGLHCFTQAFSSCDEQGLLCCDALVLGTWASVAAAQGLSSCGSPALEGAGFGSCGTTLSCSAICGILLDQGLNLCPLHSLGGGFLSTGSPGKSLHESFMY